MGWLGCLAGRRRRAKTPLPPPWSGHVGLLRVGSLHDGSLHLSALIDDLHRYTWQTMEGLCGVMATSRGTLAGNPLGDLIFSAAIRRVPHQLAVKALTSFYEVGCDNVFTQAGVCPGRYEVHSPSYVDDMVFPILAPASDIVLSVHLQ